MEVRTFGVNKGVSLGRTVDLMARNLGSAAVAFDCVVAIGRFMSRDESVFAYLEGALPPHWPRACLPAWQVCVVRISGTYCCACLIEFLRSQTTTKGFEQKQATQLHGAIPPPLVERSTWPAIPAEVASREPLPTGLVVVSAGCSR